MSSSGPVSGSNTQSVLQQAESLKSKGYETESLVVKDKGQELKLDVSRKKGKLGSRLVRKIASKLVLRFSKARSEQKRAAIELVKLQLSENKYQQYLGKGKISIAEAVPLLRQASAANTAATTAATPTETAVKPSRPLPPPPDLNLNNLTLGALKDLALNPEANSELRERALQKYGEYRGEDLAALEDWRPVPAQVRESQTQDLRKEGFSEDQIEVVLKNVGQSLGINLAKPAPAPEPKVEIKTETPEPPESNLPDITKDVGDVKKAKQEQLQAMADKAIELAESGDEAGLKELLEDTAQFKKIQFVKDQLKAKLGGSHPGTKQAVVRLVALKPQNLIDNANKKDLYNSSDIIQFAKEELASTPSYKKLAPAVLQNVEFLLDPPPPLPAVTEARLELVDVPKANTQSQQPAKRSLPPLPGENKPEAAPPLPSRKRPATEQAPDLPPRKKARKENAPEAAPRKRPVAKPRSKTRRAPPLPPKGNASTQQVREQEPPKVPERKGRTRSNQVSTSGTAQARASQPKKTSTSVGGLDPVRNESNPTKTSQSKPTASSIAKRLNLALESGGYASETQLIGDIYSVNNLQQLQSLESWAREAYSDQPDVIAVPMQAVQDEITRLSSSYRPPSSPGDTVSVRS